MKRHIGLLLTAVLLLPFALPTAAQEEVPSSVGLRPDAPPYALHGSYSVGTMDFVANPESDSPLPVAIWYPVTNETPESAHTYMIEAMELPFVGSALPEADPDMSGGPYPLVIYSHGALGFRYLGLYLTEHLASYGFVVMAPDHVGDTMANMGEEEVFLKSTVTRPRDITRVIDFAEALTAPGGELEGLIDTEHVALAGASSGAFTAFLAGGARRDFTSLGVWCAEHPDDPWFCGSQLGNEERLAELMSLDAVPEGLWPSVGDSRIDAIVPMAPGNAVMFGPEGLGAITIPTLLMAGSADQLLPYDVFGPPTYQAVATDHKAFVTFLQGGHSVFSSDCQATPWMAEMGFFWVCADPVWDMARAHDLINHFTTAFLLDVLKGDADAHAALAPSAVSFPGITYEAEGF